MQGLSQEKSKSAFINKTVNKQVVILDDEEESPVLCNNKSSKIEAILTELADLKKPTEKDIHLSLSRIEESEHELSNTLTRAMLMNTFDHKIIEEKD